ncbi:Manganese ABC transporter substrate-binding lipoprotein precursor [compost metagenome]
MSNIRNKVLFWLLFVAVALIPTLAEAKVRVVATLPTLASIVREVGGNEVEVTSLAYPTQDAHFVDARPHLVLQLNKADLLVINGSDLEVGWLPVLLTGARNGRIQPGGAGYLDASTLVTLKEIPHGKVDRSQGDIHPGGNPHYLTDPRNGGKVALGIAQKLGAIDPANRGDYLKRAKALDSKAVALAERERKRFLAIPAVRRHVVTYHQSWVYFLDWLGLEEIGTIEPKPGIPPDPPHIARLLTHMRKVHTDAIIQEAYYSSRSSKLLAEKTGVPLVVLPGGADFERGESYQDYLETLTSKVYAAISEAK